MKKFLKWVGIGFAVLIGLGVLGVIFGDQKPSGSAAAPAAPPEPAVAVSASTLFNDYDDNEVAADQKYKGKRLLVSGTVQSIDKDAFNNIAVKLKTRNEFMPVHASLDDKHENLVASLKKGAKVSWECKGGGRIIGSPIVRECAPTP